MTGATVGVGDLILSVTMLHHQKDLPARQAGLAMLKSASQKASGGAPAEKASSDIHVSPPGGTWELIIAGQGLATVEDRSDEARKSRQLMASSDSGLTLSVFMEPAQKAGDSTVVRSVYWGRAQQSPIPKKNIKLARTGEIATVEYMVPDMQGIPLNQKNMNLYLVHENTWIDIHISKTSFTEQDQATFDRVLKGVKFEAKR